MAKAEVPSSEQPLAAHIVKDEGPSTKHEDEGSSAGPTLNATVAQDEGPAAEQPLSPTMVKEEGLSHDLRLTLPGAKDEGSTSEHPLVQDFSDPSGSPMTKMQSRTRLRPLQTRTVDSDKGSRLYILLIFLPVMVEYELKSSIKKEGYSPDMWPLGKRFWRTRPIKEILHKWAKDSTVSFLALLPTAKLFGVAMEDLTLRVDDNTGSFIRVLAGNSLELISGVSGDGNQYARKAIISHRLLPLYNVSWRSFKRHTDSGRTDEKKKTL
ncbi:hypothetical protein C8J57DRAFT_1233051 [Mycena rebaudengoi]|nr:hypothetical protein C8J57DRAFT_1233051 [Mycena rebaudengoi]